MRLILRAVWLLENLVDGAKSFIFYTLSFVFSSFYCLE